MQEGTKEIKIQDKLLTKQRIDINYTRQAVLLLLFMFKSKQMSKKVINPTF